MSANVVLAIFIASYYKNIIWRPTGGKKPDPSPKANRAFTAISLYLCWNLALQRPHSTLPKDCMLPAFLPLPAKLRTKPNSRYVYQISAKRPLPCKPLLRSIPCPLSHNPHNRPVRSGSCKTAWFTQPSPVPSMQFDFCSGNEFPGWVGSLGAHPSPN